MTTAGNTGSCTNANGDDTNITNQRRLRRYICRQYATDDETANAAAAATLQLCLYKRCFRFIRFK